MNIIGETYPPPPRRVLITRLIYAIKVILIIVVCLELNIFDLFYLPTPSLYQWALKNKFSACVMLFILPNFITSNLTVTGAFEISMDNVKLWSRLETGRVPSSNELLQLLQTAINSK